MRRPSIPLSMIIGVLMGVPLVALFYLASQLILLPFFPFDMFDWISRVLPGHLVTSGIDAIVGTVRFLNLGPIDQAAKSLEMGIALVLFVLYAAGDVGSGFWVDRGWSREARPRVVSIIDLVATGSISDGRVPVGGIAWAGDRGIKRVELQVDEGEWNEAGLLEPPLGPLTWVLWRYDWPLRPGGQRMAPGCSR